MKFNNLALTTFVISGSVLLSSTTNASNPFKKPEIRVVEQPMYEEEPMSPNPYVEDFSLEQSMIQPQDLGNPLLSKASVVFKGSINGVDVYYDKATGQYIHDKEELEKVELLSSSLPDLEKVNY